MATGFAGEAMYSGKQALLPLLQPSRAAGHRPRAHSPPPPTLQREVLVSAASLVQVLALGVKGRSKREGNDERELVQYCVSHWGVYSALSLKFLCMRPAWDL